ncbi:MAG: phenylacetate-CoA ligase, partial [Gammaproteobacteria bacterium]
MYEREIETRPLADQFQIDKKSYEEQLRYLFDNSSFYKRKFREAGFSSIEDLGHLEDLGNLPFTEKDELRATQAASPPFGDHIACAESELIRIYSTSGTTGVPCYVGLTQNDLEMYATNVARGYSAAGFSSGQRIAVGFNA